MASKHLSLNLTERTPAARALLVAIAFESSLLFSTSIAGFALKTGTSVAAFLAAFFLPYLALRATTPIRFLALSLFHSLLFIHLVLGFSESLNKVAGYGFGIDVSATASTYWENSKWRPASDVLTGMQMGVAALIQIMLFYPWYISRDVVQTHKLSKTHTAYTVYKDLFIPFTAYFFVYSSIEGFWYAGDSENNGLDNWVTIVICAISSVVVAWEYWTISPARDLRSKPIKTSFGFIVVLDLAMLAGFVMVAVIIDLQTFEASDWQVKDKASNYFFYNINPALALGRFILVCICYAWNRREQQIARVGFHRQGSAVGLEPTTSSEPAGSAHV